MTGAPARALIGFIVAVIAVLTFHQGMILLLGQLGLIQARPYNLTLVGPLSIPQIVNLCFWGGVYGAVFGALWPQFTWPAWACGLILGITASLVSMFVVPLIKGTTFAAGWQAWPMARNLLINGFWGLGVGLIAPFLLPRRQAE